MFFGMPIKNGLRAIPRQFFNTLLCLLVLTLAGTVAYAEQVPLTLANALSRTVAQNPTLQVFDFRLQGLEGRRFTADQNPALEAGLEVENFLGSDNLRGVDGAEYT
ncbi:MAG: transporter, partial [Spongiibacter sp.]|nr:transporter [Spongiibacter sp.]